MYRGELMTGDDLYTIGEVAAILGVSTHAIRAWERRHGMVQPRRTRTMHRRYRSEDVAVLRKVKEAATLSGVSMRLAHQLVNQAQTLPLRGANVDRRAPDQFLHPNGGNIWRALVDVIPQLVAVIDRGGTTVACNIVAAKTFGVVVQRLTGRPLIDLVDPIDREKAELLYRPALRAVSGWDLNLSTPAGPRMYAFQTWFVNKERSSLLALVGSKLHQGDPAPRRLDG